MEIGIIGGGLSGLALALSLHQQKIKCVIYESRPEPLNIGGALMLTPNGLQVLDKLGVYKPLSKRGYNFDRAYIQHGPSNKILETIEYGNVERYGFHSLRTYRYIVLQELLRQVQEHLIPIHFNHQFESIISETGDGVEWRFRDGSTAKASLLVGADGIHSKVRAYISPVKPAFASMAAIVAAVPTAQLGLPKGEKDLNDPNNLHPIPSGIVVPNFGAFVMAPQTNNGDEVMITVQRPISEKVGAKWTGVDKEQLKSLFRQNSEHFPSIVQNAVREIPDDQLFIWPFYSIPRLECWSSADTVGGAGRVIILGDSAHAVPPSAGQGVNQAFEDVYTLAHVLGRLGERSQDNEALQQHVLAWQTYRQTRIDKVIDINRQMDLRRMPKAAGSSGQTNGEQLLDMGDMFDWLFNIDYTEMVDKMMERSVAG